ncbi:hypothetical protein KI387_007189, partial [Taxus chinensis]
MDLRAAMAPQTADTATETEISTAQEGLRHRSSNNMMRSESSSTIDSSITSTNTTDDGNIDRDKAPYDTTANSGAGDSSHYVGGIARYSSRPSYPTHWKLRESPLSSDAIFKQSHAGLFNLCVVVLIAVNSRLIIENLMKYGLLIQTGFWFSSKSLRDWPLLMCGLTLPLFPFCGFLVEKAAAHTHISEWSIIILHVIITMAEIFYPIYVIERCHSAVLSGVVLMIYASTIWLKLVSYAHTNYDLRALKIAGEKAKSFVNSSELEYPANINLGNLVYFMVAPTLCYQTSYPCTENIRKGWVLRQLGKLVIFTGVMGFIVEQYMNPTIKNSQHPLKENFLYAVERVLKLSIPTLYVWLCMFYCFFHLWLNIVAELVQFGDREFYKDWWNAKTVEEYWRMWNMPVHKWMIRHIYFPCLRRGMPKSASMVISFFLSAVFHELCIGVPCHMLRAWAFLGIMVQIPLVVLTNYLQNKFQNTM